MKELIFKNSSGKMVILLVIVTSIVYLIMPIVTMPIVNQFTNGMKILDLLPGGFNFEYVITLFNTIGEEGRHSYLFYQIPVDMVFPLLLAITSCLLISFFLKKLDLFKTPVIYLCFLPFIGGIADYAENIGVIIMLTQYPEITALTVKITSFFSVVKYSFITISFVAIIVLGILSGIDKKQKLNRFSDSR